MLNQLATPQIMLSVHDIDDMVHESDEPEILTVGSILDLDPYKFREIQKLCSCSDDSRYN